MKLVGALEQAVEYFRNRYGIPVSALLPYNALLVPFAYYFFHHREMESATLPVEEGLHGR